MDLTAAGAFVEQLSRMVTRREENLFAAALRCMRDELRETLGGSRILVLGGAGTIGSATIRGITRFDVKALHVVDLSENGLVELVRDLRARPGGISVPDFRAVPLDIGSPLFPRLLGSGAPYDLVLNFAAIKHVRSEKDTPSVLHMLDTNIVKTNRILKWFTDLSDHPRFFSVSTDKAANPVNLMGASKRIMEHVAFSARERMGFCGSVTSARFANVAFSDGSLLHGFLQRIAKGQPIAVPRDTRRYFLSPTESGTLCLLAAVLAPAGSVVVPDLAPEVDLLLLEDVAAMVVRAYAYEPKYYEDEDEVRTRVESDRAEGRWPVLLTSLDTTGEKRYEEFVSAGEIVEKSGIEGLRFLRPTLPAPATLERLLSDLEQTVGDPRRPVDKRTIVRWIRRVVPEMEHRETGKHLDNRM